MVTFDDFLEEVDYQEWISVCSGDGQERNLYLNTSMIREELSKMTDDEIISRLENLGDLVKREILETTKLVLNCSHICNALGVDYVDPCCRVDLAAYYLLYPAFLFTGSNPKFIN